MAVGKTVGPGREFRRRLRMPAIWPMIGPPDQAHDGLRKANGERVRMRECHLLSSTAPAAETGGWLTARSRSR
jgi:hypothetical protein